MDRPVHLNSVTIRGFRGFDSLDIDRVGRVNLIVGRNCVGKSSFLEAMRIHATRAHPAVLIDILEGRQEVSTRSSEPLVGSEEKEGPSGVNYLFHGYPPQAGHIRPIQIGSCGLRSNVLEIGVRWYREEQDSEGLRKLVEVPSDQWGSAPDTLPALSIRHGDFRRVVALDESTRSIQKRRYWRGEPSDMACIYISRCGTDSLNPVGRLWDRVALTEREGHVTEGLRILAPEIERISLVGEETFRSSRIVVAKIVGQKRPLPLQNLGDGASRIFEIVISLVNAMGGILLVDEIENGLHYSVQTGLWKMIMRLAKALDVQVYATSHSWDCVEAFQKISLEETGEQGVLIRLTRHDNRLVATTFDESQLAVATREQIEVR